MKTRSLLLSLFAVLFALGLAGCDLLGTNDDGPSTVTSGVYVANQGNFGDGNGSVSLYDPDSETATASAIGDLNSIVQSLALQGDRLFLTANTGGRLDVFDATDQTQQDQLAAFNGPRYLTFPTDDSALLTDQSLSGSSSVHVLDVGSDSSSITASVDVPGTPEGITHTDEQVYAALGGFSDTTLVATFDAGAPSSAETIDVGCAPRFVLADQDNEVFAVCSDTSEVVVLDGATGEEQTRLDLPGTPSTAGPGQTAFFAPDAEELYVVVDQERLTRINTASNSVDTTLGPLDGDPIGAVGYDAVRQELYVGRVPSFTESGTVTIHERDGTQTGSFDAGIAPTYIDFRRTEE
ncbi:MAG: YncE family protein [Salinivenus sp.]